MSITLLLAAVVAATPVPPSAPEPVQPAAAASTVAESAPVAPATEPVPAPALAEPAPEATAPAPSAEAIPAPVAAPAPPEVFLASVAIACPAGATRTTFPLVPNTLLELELVDRVTSGDNRAGDTFSLRVREPLKYGAVELVPVGALVHGEVTHATRNRLGGIGGELNLAARYLQLPQGRIKLRASFAASGKSRTGVAATTTALFGIAGMMIHGSNKAIPPGTPLTARLAEPVTFHCEGVALPAPTPTLVPDPAT